MARLEPRGARLDLGGIPLVFGGGSIGGLYEEVSERTAQATLAAAWDAGVRVYDTAPHSGVGRSEARIGEFLAGRSRDEFVVSTKVGRRLVPAADAGSVEGAEDFYGTPELSRVRDYGADGVKRTLEDSLTRLRLDRVDIALIHDPDDYLIEAVDSAYPALVELRDQGVVGAIGAGMNSAQALVWLVERVDLDCVLMAGRYTLLEDSASGDLLPLCQERGVAVLAGAVFNSGILAGGTHYNYGPAPADVRDRVRRLAEICAKYDVPLAAAALRHVLRHPAITAVVVGARSPDEIRADTDYLALDIPDPLWDELGQFTKG